VWGDKLKNWVGHRSGRLVALEQQGRKLHVHCDCGVEKWIHTQCFRKGQSKSCGCLRKERSKGRPIKDLIGLRFNFLTVVDKIQYPNKRGVYWRCQCDCGNVIERLGGTLREKGKSQSCGCQRRGRPLGTDLTGKRFGRLTVLEKVYREGKLKWRCQCDCGVVKEIENSGFFGRPTKSCGCLQREKNRRGCRPGEAARHYHLDKYKWGAKLRGLQWGLSDMEFYSLIDGSCYYCGNPPSPTYWYKRGESLLANGVDRVNSSIGYTPQNCVSCCKFCNNAKGVLSKDSFLDHLKRVSEFKAWERYGNC
jgi:hypothetical protein